MAKRILQISKIRLDGNTQPRVELDEFLMAEYKEAYLAKVEMPPLEVMFDGASYWLWDGFHRRWGADRAGLEKLPCNVTEGTREDAQWASYGANVTHGLRRTNKDKEKAVKAALRHPDGPGKSDVEIADHCGVASNTVLKYRKELETSSQIAKIDVRTVTRGGKTYEQDTSNIGNRKPDAPAPVEPDEDEPEVDEEPEEDQQVSSADLVEADEADETDYEPADEDEQDEEPAAPDPCEDFTDRLLKWCRMQLDNLDLTPGQMATVMRRAAKEVGEW